MPRTGRLNLSGRVAIVTGGSSGIGREIARALTGRGCLCVLLARREDRLRDAAHELGAEFEVCDVAERQAVERTAASIRERHPAIAVLVNNAGVPARGSFLTAKPTRIEEVVRINYLGAVWCLRAFLPALEAAAPSDVVNIVSVAGTVAVPDSGPYSAAKHAQLAFSRAMGPELAPRGIRVHTINPGFIETEGFPQRSRMPGRLAERTVREPDVVASGVLRALDRNRTEIFVPGWYRPVSVVQAVAPGLMTRALASRRMRRRHPD
jgi:uncharacterized protein